MLIRAFVIQTSLGFKYETRFKYETENEQDSGRSSKMTRLCK